MDGRCNCTQLAGRTAFELDTRLTTIYYKNSTFKCVNVYFTSGNLQQRGNLEDLGVDNVITLKSVINKSGLRACSSVFWCTT